MNKIGGFICLLLCLSFCKANDNFIWYKIPEYNVASSVNHFLDYNLINNCFYKLQNEDTLLLKCWRNEKLVNVEISIKNNPTKNRFNYVSISI